MRLQAIAVVGLLVGASYCVLGKKVEHQWSLGKVLDENRARYFAGMLNNSSSQTSENGTWNGNASSTSVGDSTNTQVNGDYSGTRSTSASGMSVPIYKVYDNLVIEGEDTVYITSERLRWRWSKGAHVVVNDTVKYYVDGRKLHILDNDNKEHSVEILKTVRNVQKIASSVPENQPALHLQKIPAAQSQVSIQIDSTPSGGDIEVDGGFVGNTPSTVTLSPGSHQIVVKKKGYTDWTKTLNVTGGNIHLSPELEPAPGQ
jgi:hypothetical protein